MKPIKIFRHIDCEGPAYLQTQLEQRALPWELIRIDQGEPVDTDPAKVSGLIFMGGSMSVNDPLDWIAEEIQLIQAAVKQDIPVLGVCLGSQLLAKALGAKVYPGSAGCMEIGWFPVECVTQSDWTSELPDSFEVFHWHGETFDLPDGATRLFSNERYLNQGFAFGPHLALQFHVEMDSASVSEWLTRYTEDIEKRCVKEHDTEAILYTLESRVSQLQIHAEVLFNRWLAPIVS